MAPAVAETFSYSRISTWEQCPRKYELKYVRKLPEAFRTVEAVLGNVVHEALAWLYQERAAGRTRGRADLLVQFDALWRERIGPDVRVVKRGDSLDRHRLRGRTLLANHYERRFVKDRSETLAIEEKFLLRLAGRHLFTGIIDRVARGTDGWVRVIDYKTTGRPPGILTDDVALQLRSYGVGCIVGRNVGIVRLEYQYLENGTILTEDMDREDANETVRNLVGRIDEILAATSFPARPSALCGWCGYNETCDAARQSGRFSRRTTTRAGGSGDRCPRCGGRLELRHGRWGTFLGCQNFPACRYTRDA